MKKRERNVLIAGGIGFLAVVSFFVVRNILKTTNHNSLDEFRLFSEEEGDEQHGVEYFYQK